MNTWSTTEWPLSNELRSIPRQSAVSSELVLGALDLPSNAVLHATQKASELDQEPRLAMWFYQVKEGESWGNPANTRTGKEFLEKSSGTQVMTTRTDKCDYFLLRNPYISKETVNKMRRELPEEEKIPGYLQTMQLMKD